MNKIVNMEEYNKQKEEEKKARKDEIFEQFDDEMDEYMAILHRLDMKESAGKEISDDDIINLIKGMGNLSEARKNKKEQLSQLR